MRALALAVVVAACGSGGGFPDAPRAPDAAHPGTFTMSWTINSMASGMTESCMQAGATQVLVGLSEEAPGTNAFSQPFSCTLGSAASGSITAGTYDFTFALTGASGVIAMGAPQMGITIQSDKTAQVMPVVFNAP